VGFPVRVGVPGRQCLAEGPIFGTNSTSLFSWLLEVVPRLFGSPLMMVVRKRSRFAFLPVYRMEPRFEFAARVVVDQPVARTVTSD
jgi:hypothetical protein